MYFPQDKDHLCNSFYTVSSSVSQLRASSLKYCYVPQPGGCETSLRDSQAAFGRGSLKRARGTLRPNHSHPRFLFTSWTTATMQEGRMGVMIDNSTIRTHPKEASMFFTNKIKCLRGHSHYSLSSMRKLKMLWVWSVLALDPLRQRQYICDSQCGQNAGQNTVCGRHSN